RRVVNRAGGWFIKRDQHLIEIGGDARQSVSKRFPTPPAARGRAAENNLAEIMFTGITHYRFLFRWIRKCCRLRAQFLRQTRSEERRVGKESRSRCARHL